MWFRSVLQLAAEMRSPIAGWWYVGTCAYLCILVGFERLWIDWQVQPWYLDFGCLYKGKIWLIFVNWPNLKTDLNPICLTQHFGLGIRAFRKTSDGMNEKGDWKKWPWFILQVIFLRMKFMNTIISYHLSLKFYISTLYQYHLLL